jgi:hypothetical protein
MAKTARVWEMVKHIHRLAVHLPLTSGKGDERLLATRELLNAETFVDF